jgi:ABC-2 type transport system ATP-binding protein
LDPHPVLKTGFDAPLPQVETLPGVRMARYTGEYLEIETVDPQATLAALQRLASEMGRPIGNVTLRQPNLEDVFLKLTGRTLAA